MVHRSSSIHSIESVNSSNEAPQFLGKQHPTSATKTVASGDDTKQTESTPPEQPYAIPDAFVVVSSPKKITRSRSDRFSIDTSSSTNSSSTSSSTSTEKQRLSNINVTNRSSDYAKSRNNECVQDSSDSCSSAAVGRNAAAVRSAPVTPTSVAKATPVRTKKFTKSPPKKSSMDAPTTSQSGLMCSLPLDRLSDDIIDLLLVKKASVADVRPVEADAASEDIESDAAAAILQKTMCLYCDRIFSSHKLYLKHSQRVHEASEGRRSSQRQSYTSLLLYPGCSHCNNGKTTSLPADELPALFHHLIEIHFDRYFACKSCRIRFQNSEALKEHAAEHHPISPAKPAVVYKTRKKVAASSTSPEEPDKSDEDVEELEQPAEPVLLRSSRRQQQAKLASLKTAPTLRKKQMLRTEETILTRLGITQNRSPRTRRGCIKPRPDLRAETPNLKTRKSARTAGGSTNANQTLETAGSGEAVPIMPMSTSSGRLSGSANKTESLSSTFDECFYESVNLNVRQNLSCHLDGKLDASDATKPICPPGLTTMPAVRSTLVTSPLVNDNEIHEATALTALTAFPTLLTAQQYGAEPMPLGKIKKPITKNSWKWKWDCVKKYKYVNEGGKFVKKIKQPIAGLRDLSKLDMWTQLTMRTKHEVVRRQEFEVSGTDATDSMAIGEIARQEKQKLIEQLNTILDRRILPQINLEQNDQRVVKLERVEEVAADSKAAIETTETQPTDDLPSMLNLSRRNPALDVNRSDLVLSGEWARPRCYVCYGCGSRFETIKQLDDHKSTRHPHVHSTHYEIVGKELIDGNLFRHFYIPSAALLRHSEYAQRNAGGSSSGSAMLEDSMDSVVSAGSLNFSNSFDMDSVSQHSKSLDASMTSSVNSPASPATETKVTPLPAPAMGRRECTKCKRPCNGMIDLYRHMLDCSNDYAWVLAKKRQNIKYRYFGSRRRKAQRSSASKRRIRPKKEEQADTPQRMREPQPPKPRPSDGE